jgi:DNA-binding transcriptional regulator PaaX
MRNQTYITSLLDDPFNLGVSIWLAKQPRPLADIVAVFGLEPRVIRTRLARLVRAGLIAFQRTDTGFEKSVRLFQTEREVFERAQIERLSKTAAMRLHSLYSYDRSAWRGAAAAGFTLDEADAYAALTGEDF